MAQASPGGGASSGADSSSTTYNIKPNPVSPAGEEQSMQYPQIMDILHGLTPGDMSDAADAFKNLANVLDSIATDLATTGNQLAPHWTGTAAQAAMSKFQSLHDQAAQLAADAHTTAGVASWLGTDVLPQYKNIPSPQVMSKSDSDAVIGGAALGPEGAAGGYVAGMLGIGSDGTNKANSAARSYMSSLNQQLTKANDALPSSISAPTAGYKGSNPWITPTGGGSGSGSGGSGSGGGYGGSGSGGGSAMPTYSGSPMASSSPMTAKMTPIPSSSAGSSSVGSLQGYTPPTTSPTTTSPYGGGTPVSTPSAYSGMPGGGSANPFSKIPAMPGGGMGSGGGGVPGEDDDMPGEGGLADGMAGEGLAGGAAGDAAAAGGAGAAGDAAGAAAGTEGASGEGMEGMPMGGAGSGQQNKERQRQAWMHEDENIWGVPTDGIGPVIG